MNVINKTKSNKINKNYSKYSYYCKIYEIPKSINACKI